MGDTSTPRLGGLRKQRYTLQLPSDLVEQLRDAVYWTPGMTLASLAETALRRAVAELEQTRGEPFPERTGELTAGRPVKNPPA